MRISREEWAKRVERWSDSGLTAKEFAAELGINPRSLVFWKWQLSKGQARRTKSSPTPSRAVAESTPAPLPLVELAPTTPASGFELELRGGRRVMVPATFDADALRRLLAVLEGSS